MHITNAIFGQSLSSTLAQIINATGMGVLACGLMLATKSIWPAVLMHAINDLPMTVLEVKKIKFAVSPMEILGTAAWSTIPIVLGLALTLIALLRDDLLFARASGFDRDLILAVEGVIQRLGEKFLSNKVFSYLGLVEESYPNVSTID